MDIIGKIPTKKHAFVLVATDYSTKWVKAEPMKNVTSYAALVLARNP